MRALSALAVCGACVWGACAYRARLHRRVRMYVQLRMLAAHLRTCCLDRREPIPGLIRSLARSPDFAALEFLAACEENHQAGRSLPSVWQEAAARFAQEKRLEPEIAALLPGMGNVLCGGSAAQIDACLQTFAQAAERSLQRSRRQLAENGKLCVQIGAGAGILLAILIL